MIKKLSLFLSAIAIGILSIFGSISTKNAAEPQYFLENPQVKKAVVENNTNNFTFYLDNNLQFNAVPLNEETLFNLNENSKIYYIDTNENYNLLDITFNNNYVLTFDVDNIYSNFYQIRFRIVIENEPIGQILRTNLQNAETNWYYRKENGETTLILGFKLENVSLNENKTLENINNIVNPYIGNLINLPSEEPPTPPLDQINTLVSDIVNWFTNIFNGLSNVFYDPTANKLTAWGTVMFIGVAIMLISMALKWVISLIRGV